MRGINRVAPIVAVWMLGTGHASAAGSEDALIEAVRTQDLKAVQALVKRGANVNVAEPDGATALHWAAYTDDLAAADLLLRSRARVNAANDLGVTPLLLACRNGSAPMVKRLLEAGADPNVGPPGRETPLMVAAQVGVPAVLKLLLSRGADVNAKEASHGQTALMWAVAEKHADIVKLLVEVGADTNARTISEGTTAKEAMSNGKTGDRLHPPGANSFTPLLFAARVGDLESTRLLLDAGAKVNDVSVDGLSPVVLATVRGHPKVAGLLLQRGADPNADGAGYTALHWAAGSWETELTVRAITPERDGEWTTVAGLKDGRLELVNALLTHGANPNARMRKAPERAGSSKNPGLRELEGATPFLLAAMSGAADIMRTLVEHGADPALPTSANGTPLMAAAGLGRVPGEVTVKENDTLAAARLAIELGADVNAVDKVGNTALHYAGFLRRDSTIQFLADKGAKLDVRNKYGETAYWTSGLVLQFAGGGTFQWLPSSAGALLRRLGASTDPPPYDYARPADWPDLPRSRPAPPNPESTPAAPEGTSAPAAEASAPVR